MALEIKVECRIGEESSVISSLLPALAGMTYEIRVSAPTRSKKANTEQKPPASDAAEKEPSKQRGAKTPPKPRPPGQIKLAILQAHAVNTAVYHTQEAIQKATGFTADQARSAIADAVGREEL